MKEQLKQQNYMISKLCIEINKTIKKIGYADIYRRLKVYYGNDFNLTLQGMKDKLSLAVKDNKIINARLASNAGLLFAIAHCYDISIDNILKNTKPNINFSEAIDADKFYDVNKKQYKEEAIKNLLNRLKIFYKNNYLDKNEDDEKKILHLVRSLLTTPYKCTNIKGVLHWKVDEGKHYSSITSFNSLIVSIFDSEQVTIKDTKLANDAIVGNFTMEVSDSYDNLKKTFSIAVNPLRSKKFFFEDNLSELYKMGVSIGAITENRLLTDQQHIKSLLELMYKMNSNTYCWTHSNYQFAYYLLGLSLFYRSINLYLDKYCEKQSKSITISLINLQKRFVTYNKNKEISLNHIEIVRQLLKDGIIHFSYMNNNIRYIDSNNINNILDNAIAQIKQLLKK